MEISGSSEPMIHESWSTSWVVDHRSISFLWTMNCIFFYFTYLYFFSVDKWELNLKFHIRYLIFNHNWLDYISFFFEKKILLYIFQLKLSASLFWGFFVYVVCIFDERIMLTDRSYTKYDVMRERYHSVYNDHILQKWIIIS